jgi:hypothetical protein
MRDILIYGRYREPKRALHGIPGCGKRRGKPKKRWLDDVRDALRRSGVKSLRIKAMDRTEWRKICEAANDLQEKSCIAME